MVGVILLGADLHDVELVWTPGKLCTQSTTYSLTSHKNRRWMKKWFKSQKYTFGCQASTLPSLSLPSQPAHFGTWLRDQTWTCHSLGPSPPSIPKLSQSDDKLWQLVLSPSSPKVHRPVSLVTPPASKIATKSAKYDLKSFQTACPVDALNSAPHPQSSRATIEGACQKL